MQNPKNFRLPVLLLLAIMLSCKPAHSVITKVYDQSVCQGTQIVVPVYVWDFDSIGTLSLTLEYDQTALSYVGIQNLHPNLAGTVTINNVPGNPAKIRMASYTLICHSIPDSGILVELKFNVSGLYSSLSWPAAPGFNEYGDCLLNPINDQFFGGSVTTASPVITSNPPPALTICAGLDTTLSFTANGPGTLSYTWQTYSPGSSIWLNLTPTPPYSNVNSPNLHISQVPGSLYLYTYRCVVSNLCPPVYTQPVVLLPQPCASISGELHYENAVFSPLSNVVVLLSSNNAPAQSAITGLPGNFVFPALYPDTYTAISVPTIAPGGINAADALLALIQFTNPSTLQGLRKKAADVDGSGYVNALDALLIAKRFAGFITTFPAGDWCMEPLIIQLGGSSTNYSIALKAICYGDLDGSFVP